MFIEYLVKVKCNEIHLRIFLKHCTNQNLNSRYAIRAKCIVLIYRLSVYDD